MKNLLRLKRLALLVALVGAAAPVRADDLPKFIAGQEITAMAPRTATFTKRVSEFTGSFTAADGSKFVVGDPRGEQSVWQFVCALKEGQTYKFPDVFTNYLAAPHYATVEEIAKMPACTATLASRTPCSSQFVTPEGKWFGIGDPGSEAPINRFIGSIKDGQTYQFPEAFLKFQNDQHPARP